MAKNAKLRYNERSWAIDLISHINSSLLSTSTIKRASGEYTLSTDGNPLFPDILLYADESSGRVLQGWELKMPDTPINNTELLSNAEKKARILGLNSFVVWNVTEAILYIFNDKTGAFDPYEESLFRNSSIKTREDVSNHPDLWKSGANEIIEKLNRFFDGGKILGVSPEIMFSDSGIVELFFSCQVEVKRFIEEKIQTDSEVDAKIKLWWRHVELGYPGEKSPAGPLAYHVLLRWFNRFVFSNILKAYTDSVKKLKNVKQGTTVEEALELFSAVSKKSDFRNVFERSDFDHLIPDSVWSMFISFNDFLQEFEFAKIDRAVLQNILQSAILTTIKKTAGLYVTPEPLAHLLVLLTLADKSSMAIDPFCGTGTIVNAILSVKSDYNISGRDAIRSTWGSDKFAFPIQIATLAVSTPENMNETLRIFTHDAFELGVGEKIKFIDPSTGNDGDIEVPLFSAIISNLPFVQFEDLNKLNPLAYRKIESFYSKHSIPESDKLDGRSDLYAYIPFLIYDILDDNGHLGIIISNSWLATEWGLKFRNLLNRFYSIKYVVTSANGRWFDNSDVVTNLLVCHKKDASNDDTFSFISMLEDLNSCDIDNIATDIITQSDSSSIAVNTISKKNVDMLDELSIGWTSCFSKIDWFLSHKDKFEALNKYSLIARGERRGWNAMFYPSQSDCATIESEFIKPVIKTPRGITSLTVIPTGSAFCCSCPLEELELCKKTGALSWINRFKNGRNNKGELLVESLRRAKLFWYQMDAATLADFVLSMNPDTRLFIAKTPEPTFVDQRLIRITVKDGIDCKLLHALLNSTFSMYFIEALGFGRGLGVLDINATKIKKGLYIPDMCLISRDASKKIISAFSDMKKRPVKMVLEEIKEPDRHSLDNEIANAIGLPLTVVKDVYAGLQTLYRIRKSVGR